MQSSLRTSSCRRRSHVRTGLVQPVRCRLTRTSARRERQRHAILRMQDSVGESTLTMPRLLALPALSTVTTNALPVAFRLLPRRHSRCRPAPLPAPPPCITPAGPPVDLELDAKALRPVPELPLPLIILLRDSGFELAVQATPGMTPSTSHSFAWQRSRRDGLSRDCRLEGCRGSRRTRHG